jgi:ABC-2 type transport system permease protein
LPEPTFGGVVGAFLRRDLLVASETRSSLVARTVAIVVALASFAYLATFVDAGGGAIDPRYGRSGYLGFFLVGLAVGEIFHAISMSLSAPIRQAQLAGTLEAILSTPAPAAWVLAGVAASSLLFAFVRLAVYFAAAQLLFDVTLGPIHAGSLILGAALSLAAFLSIAIFGGAVTMRLRRTDPVTMLIGMAAALVGGVLFPVDLLPWPLADLAYALPLAPSLEVIRRSIFAAAPPAALARELIALGAFVLLVAPLSIAFFARALKRARQDGSLGFY